MRRLPRICRPSGFRSMQTTTGSRSFPAWFVRGGTSNGLVIQRSSLPPESHWPSILPPAMGSPDPQHARQLNGLGSGVSSTSKIVILSPPPPDTQRHVDYTFVQVGIRDGSLDVAGNCGNMSSIVGPAAWDMGYADNNTQQLEGLVSTDVEGRKWATLRLYNTNTSKIIASTFRVDGEPLRYCTEGGYEMDGVPGTQSQVTMEFLDPAGAKTGKALPTGNEVDVLELPDGHKVQASLVDVGNPGVFVAASSVGLTMPCTPLDVEADGQLKTKLEQIRRAGASAMGLDPDTDSVPKIVLLFPTEKDEKGVDIRCLAMSMGQAHKAVPLTLALCLGGASKISGTLAEGMIAAGERRDTVTIAHPSGKLDVGTRMEDGKIVAAKLLRTARVMMKGDVFY